VKNPILIKFWICFRYSTSKKAS